MLLSILSTDFDSRALERRLGFTDLYAVTNEAGVERFGALQLTGGGLTGLLQLRGLNYWLAAREREQGVLQTLQQHLPEFPVQFILQRRLLDVDRYVARWRKRVARRFVHSAATGEQLWADFSGQVRRWHEHGAAEVWCGLAVSGSSESELAARLAQLYASLPFECSTLGSNEIAERLLGWLRPGSDLSEDERARLADSPFSVIGPTSSYLTADSILLEKQTSVSFYCAQPPSPAAPAGEWLWPVLRSDALAGYEYDVTVHLQPARYEVEMLKVLERRLTHIDARLAELVAPDEAEQPRDRFRTPLPDGPITGPHLVYSQPTTPATLIERANLEIERAEVEKRLHQMRQGEDRLKELSLLFALRAPQGHAASQQTRFAGELERLGFAPTLMRGRSDVERGLRTSLPLNRNQCGRHFTLNAAAVAPLTWLACATPPPDLTYPPLGLARDRTVVTFAPEAAAAPGHRTISGGKPEYRHKLAQQWAVLSYLASFDLYGYDPEGRWRIFAEQLGGHYLLPGAEGEQGGNLNLLATSYAELDDPARFEQWIVESADLLTLLAGGLDEEQVSHLKAALFQLGLNHLERRQPLSLKLLASTLNAGGYRQLGHALLTLSRGRWRRLFVNQEDSRLGKVEHEADPAASILLVGHAHPTEVPEPLAAYLAKLTVSRLLVNLRATAPGVALAGFPGLRRGASNWPAFIFADAAAALSDPGLADAARRSLVDEGQPLSLWLLADRADDLLVADDSPSLLGHVPHHLLLRQDAGSYASFAALTHLSPAVAQAVAALQRTQVLLATNDDAAIINVV